MKNPKKLTRQMKELLKQKNLNPADWLMERNTTQEIVFVHRHSDRTRKVVSK